MSKPKNHIPNLEDELQQYAEGRMLDFHQYSPYHMRIMDGGYVILDVWTTGRYYIVMTDYKEITDSNIREREGEKGNLPLNTLKLFLDKVFFLKSTEYPPDSISQSDMEIMTGEHGGLRPKGNGKTTLHE